MGAGCDMSNDEQTVHEKPHIGVLCSAQKATGPDDWRPALPRFMQKNYARRASSAALPT